MPARSRTGKLWAKENKSRVIAQGVKLAQHLERYRAPALAVMFRRFATVEEALKAYRTEASGPKSLRVLRGLFVDRALAAIAKTPADRDAFFSVLHELSSMESKTDDGNSTRKAFTRELKETITPLLYLYWVPKTFFARHVSGGRYWPHFDEVWLKKSPENLIASLKAWGLAALWNPAVSRAFAALQNEDATRVLNVIEPRHRLPGRSRSSSVEDLELLYEVNAEHVSDLSARELREDGLVPPPERGQPRKRAPSKRAATIAMTAADAGVSRRTVRRQVPAPKKST